MSGTDPPQPLAYATPLAGGDWREVGGRLVIDNRLRALDAALAFVLTAIGLLLIGGCWLHAGDKSGRSIVGSAIAVALVTACLLLCVAGVCVRQEVEIAPGEGRLFDLLRVGIPIRRREIGLDAFDRVTCYVESNSVRLEGRRSIVIAWGKPPAVTKAIASEAHLVLGLPLHFASRPTDRMA